MGTQYIKKIRQKERKNLLGTKWYKLYQSRRNCVLRFKTSRPPHPNNTF